MQKQKLSVRIGSDPEMMLACAKTSQLRSAIPIVPEGKGAFRSLNKRGTNAVGHDNVLIEFNTEPAASEHQFVRTIGTVLGKIHKIVQPHGLQLKLQASAEFPASELEEEEARIFGCEPDYDAWKLRRNEVPAGASEKPFRSAGGHLHIGVCRDRQLNEILLEPLGKVEAVKAMDIFCGIPSVFLDKDPTAAARRALYGGAGAHRPKGYGVEYRALGNWWLASPSHTRLVYQLALAGLQVLRDGKLPKLIETITQERIVATINNSDIAMASELYTENIKPLLPAKTRRLCGSLAKLANFEFHKSWRLK
jgi:hypothetical protein